MCMHLQLQTITKTIALRLIITSSSHRQYQILISVKAWEEVHGPFFYMVSVIINEWLMIRERESGWVIDYRSAKTIIFVALMYIFHRHFQYNQRYLSPSFLFFLTRVVAMWSEWLSRKKVMNRHVINYEVHAERKMEKSIHLSRLYLLCK